MTQIAGKVATIDHLRSDERAERRASLMALQAQLSNAGIAYHTIIINLNVMLVTATVFMTGCFLSMAGSASTGTRILLSAVPLTLAVIALAVTWIVRSHYFAIASVIRRIDEVNGVFELGHFIPGETLFPSEWKAFGSAA